MDSALVTRDGAGRLTEVVQNCSTLPRDQSCNPAYLLGHSLPSTCPPAPRVALHPSYPYPRVSPTTFFPSPLDLCTGQTRPVQSSRFLLQQKLDADQQLGLVCICASAWLTLEEGICTSPGHSLDCVLSQHPGYDEQM